MSERTLSILSGIAQGVEKTATNLVNIGMKKDQLRREDEEFQLNKKVKDAQLKVYEAKTSPEAMERERTEFKQANQLHDLQVKIDSGKINKAEIDVRKEELELKKEGELRIMAGVATLEDSGYTPEEARNKMGSLFMPETATVDGSQVPVAPGEFVRGASAYDRGDAAIDDPFLSELGKATRTKTGISQTEAAEELYGKKSKVTPATKKELDALGDAINDGAITTQAEALEALSQSETTMRMKGADIDYIKSKITELLPEQADIPEEESSMLGEIKNFISGTTTQKLSQVVDFIVQKFNKTKEEATRIIQKLQGE